jgi:branched-chain amino acid transport system permease protein
MVTLALAQCVYYVFYQAVDLTGGENGLRGVNVSRISVLGWELNFLDPTVKYYIILAFVLAALWIFSHILNSPFGAVLEAIRENEHRARACGYDVARTKLLAFVLSGAFCGLAGALYTLHLSIVPIDILHYLTSGQVVMMALLGGMGTFFGPFVGAAAFLFLEDVLTVLTPHWQLFLGLVFIAFVLFFPRGIWGSLLHWMTRP